MAFQCGVFQTFALPWRRLKSSLKTFALAKFGSLLYVFFVRESARMNGNYRS